MTPFMTPIFDFHQVISTFKTTLMILALSLMKTSLNFAPSCARDSIFHKVFTSIVKAVLLILLYLIRFLFSKSNMRVINLDF